MDQQIREQIEVINTIFNRTNELYSRWAKKKGLNYNSLMVLYAIDSKSSCTQKQICEEWLIPKQTVNTILKDFMKQGYVELETDVNDKRGKHIRFTKYGYSYASKILNQLYEMEERAMQQMKPELRSMLIESNKQYGDFFEKEVEHE